MKKILTKNAFSLLELIIASVLVIIVVMGIFSINSVLSNNNQDFGQRYSVKSATQITLNHILNNVSEAIGSGTSINGGLDKGILIGANGDLGASANDTNTFCVHQDIPPLPTGSYTIDNTPINSPPTAPPNYSNSTYPDTTNDSRWLCYTWYPSTYQIQYCSMPYYPYDPVNFLYRGAMSCDQISSPSPQYLGTAFRSPAVNFSPTTGWFTITITNCLDNTLTAGYCPSSNNPQAQISGSVFPPQEGLQQN